MAQVEKVCFKIEGEWLTEHCRSLVQEGKWRHAYETLMDGLEGIEANMVFDILRGALKLVGVNTLDVAEDDQTEAVSEMLDEVYRGCFVFNNKVFKPYGYGDQLGYADISFARQVFNGDRRVAYQNDLHSILGLGGVALSSPNFRQEGALFRYYHYARNPLKDLCVLHDTPEGQVFVYYEESSIDVPLWYKLTKEAKLPYVWNLDYLTPSSVIDEDSEYVYRSPFEELKRETAVERALFNEKTEEDYLAEEDAIRQKVIAFADEDTDYGWRIFEGVFDGKETTIRVPWRAFICASLGRLRLQNVTPEYTPFSYSGMKLQNDDPCHTDAWIGAGFPADKAYDSNMPEQKLFMEALYEIQSDFTQFEFDILTKGSKSYFSGKFVTEDTVDRVSKEEWENEDIILVVATADPKWAVYAGKVAAFVVGTGSKLAHLTIVSREEATPVIRMKNAENIFMSGARGSINMDTGEISMFY